MRVVANWQIHCVATPPHPTQRIIFVEPQKTLHNLFGANGFHPQPKRQAAILSRANRLIVLACASSSLFAVPFRGNGAMREMPCAPLCRSSLFFLLPLQFMPTVW